MKLTGEQLEYAISQYVDGTLSTLDRSVIEAQLQIDADARLLVIEYTRLTQILRDVDPLPVINFSNFNATVSAAIADEAIPVQRPWVLRSHGLRYLAAAAALAFAATVGVHFIPKTTGPAPVVATAVKIDVQGPAVETASAAPSIHLSVGPSEALAQRGDALNIGDDALITHTPRVVISAADLPARSDLPLY